MVELILWHSATEVILEVAKTEVVSEVAEVISEVAGACATLVATMDTSLRTAYCQS